MRKITLLLILLSFSFSLSAQTYLQENFDTEIPATWTITDEGAATGDSWASGQQGGFNDLDGTPGAFVDSDANGNGTQLIETLTSPVFDTTGAVGLFLDFDQFYRSGGSDSGIVEVYDGTNWVEVLNQTATTGSFPNPNQQNINITAYSNANMQIRFIYDDGDTWAWYWMVDNIHVYNSTCNTPSALTATTTGDSTADITWTVGGTETAWEIVIQPVGTGVPTTPGTAITTNPYNATLLTPSTAYEVYLLADCAANGQSNWVGPINFTTFNTPPPPPVGVTCASGTSTLVFTENFGTDTNTDPTGWTGTGFDGSNGNWDITAAGGNSGGTGPTNAYDGGTGMHLEYEASGDATDIATAISPAINLTSATDGAELAFFMHAFGDDIGTLNVNIGTSATGPFTNLYTWVGDLQTTAAEAWVPIGINLDAYLGQTIYLEFSYGGAGTGFEGDISIDQITVETCGNFCIEPNNLTVINITDTTADISWTGNNGETTWEIVIQPAGTGVPTTSGTVITTNPYNATLLTSSTAYEVYLLADCGANGQSNWFGPINFTTLNTPPPPPVGVTCASGTSTLIFTETFGTDTNTDPTGWTGTGFDGSNGNWDITAAGGNSGGTGPTNAYDGGTGMHLEYEASGDATDIATAISPAIDLTSAIDGAELAFFMHAFGDDIGTLNVNIGTSAAGPFTNLYTWVGDLQTTAAEAWVPIGINLDAYLGQIIYLEFSYGGAGTGFEGDMSIDQITVETCGNFCIDPSNLTVTNITGTTADISWTANNGETEWQYVIQPAGTGTPTGAGTIINTTTLNATNLNFSTDYEFYVLSDCGTNGMSLYAGPLNFSTTIQVNFQVDCTVGPTNFVYCYENNDSNVFTFTSNDGTPLTFIINSGEVEDGWDELVVFDTDGVTDLNAATPYGTNGDGDVGGLIYQSTGDTISFQVQSDGSFNCSGNGYTPIDVSVSCATCIFQDVEFTAVDDCDSGTDQFFVEVNVVDLGSAVTLDISDGTNTVSTTTTGVVQIGPYPVNTDVTVVVSNQDDSNCITTSSVLNIPACPPANDDCENAIVAIANADSNCTNITSGTIYGATQSPQGNSCFGTANDDVWFSFEALATDHAVSLLNVAGDTTFMSFGLYEGADCNNLTNIGCSNNNQIVGSGLTIGETYYVQVFSNGNLPFQNTTFDLCIISLPPPITTNTDQFTVQQLVEDVLIDSPCSLVSNITFSTGTNFGSTNGIGYFEQNGSDFPFESGVVLTTGDVLNAPGPESGTLSDGDNAWPGDADLENEIGLPAGQTRNATVLEFDFVPVTSEISFDFIFAAEEYGTFQCTFSDAFAFLLTDAAGNTVNLAVVPGTTTPISVLNVRDEAFNGNCASVNPEFFDAYYDVFGFQNGIGQNPLTSPTNFRGRTVPLTAMATVIPNNSYSIKLVIADDQDRLFDSAVFLSAGSFDIGEIDLGDDILLTSGNANCLGDEVILDIGIDIPNNSTLTWYFTDPEIPGILEPITGENGPTLTVNETGIYTAEILITGTTCFFMDDVLIEFFPNPIVAFAEDYVIKCANEDYDISINVENSGELPNALTYNFYIAGDLVQATSSNTYTLTAEALEQGNITVTVVDDVTGCSGEAAMFVEFYENANCVDQPQGLSPNGDGVNDCLILDHLEDRRDITKAQVFNRYGVKVWELTGYVDQWCGTDQDGNILPVGTYYYNVYLKDVAKPLTTFIYLNY